MALIRTGGTSHQSAITLIELGEPAVEPLLSEYRRKSGYPLDAAYILSRIEDPRADAFMQEAYDAGEMDVVRVGYAYFIRSGNLDYLPTLVTVLEDSNDQEMATDYLNCGNDVLADAARAWAKAHNCVIVPSSGGGSGVTWGGR